MLILAPRIGGTLIIGDDVKVMGLSVKRNQLRVGIDVPKTVSVHREEGFKRIATEKTG